MTKRIAIIGAGPGGYAGAIRAAQLGAKVFLVEDDNVGGTCLNRGCIPTKSYYKSASLIKDIKSSQNFGVNVKDFSVDGNKLQDRKNEIVEQLKTGVEHLIGSYDNIEFLRGKASFKDDKRLEVSLHTGETQEVEADYIVIATGSKPTMTEVEGIDLEGVITSDDLLEMREIPEDLIVIGGGVIGLEFASIYQELGSQVTLLASRILKNIDREITNKLPREFKKRGMKVHKEIRAKRIEKHGDKLKVVAKFKNKDKEIEVIGDKVLMASGRGPMVDGLNLDKIGIKYGYDGIEVDKSYRTNIDGIYAIGDVNNTGIQLAHVATAQATYVVEKIMGEEPDINLDVYPDCVFTLPEVAFVGMNEEDLKNSDIEYKESKFLFMANGKALTLDSPEGFVKVYAEKDSNKILGVTIMGPHANDLIHEGALAVSNQLNAEDIQRTIHAHPTLSEAFMEAVDDLSGKAVHSIPRKR